LRKIDLSSPDSSSKKSRLCDERPDKDAASSVASSAESIDYSSPFNIDWTSAEEVEAAYCYHRPSDDVTSVSVREQLLWLADNYTPAEMKNVLLLVAVENGYDARSLKLKSLKTRKQVCPVFVDLVVDVMNERTDIRDGEDDIPVGIDVNEDVQVPDALE
jgi:hypothetical protein